VDPTYHKSIAHKLNVSFSSTSTKFVLTVSGFQRIENLAIIPPSILLVDATDSKGEPIHQTFTAKKMQRLDESPDYRPFHFRIQAFTLAFLEEVSAIDSLRK
jgi:hypothetical protein